MPIERIPFVNREEGGFEILAGGMPAAHNVVVDPKGAVRRRPGIRAHSGAPTGAIDAAGIHALFVTVGGLLYAVSASAPQRIYQVTSGGSTNITTGDNPPLRGTERPTIAETEAMLVMVAGDLPLKIPLGGNAALLGGSPPKATHVAANNARLLLNDIEPQVAKGAILYSGQALGSSIAGHETWPLDDALVASYFQAESRPDNVVAIGETASEIFAFGTSSVQIFSPDPNLDYVPLSTREFGCSAPYSVIRRDQEFTWLDHLRRFVVSDGRSFQIISDPIAAVIDALPDVSDCFGYRVTEGFIDALVWCFPGSGLTLAYQFGSGWGRWSGWDDGANNWKPLTILSHHIRQDTNANIVGTTAGKIGELSFDAQTDLGERINARVETGYISHGTDTRKHCMAVRLTLKRGEVTGATGPQGFFGYRDRPGPWTTKPIDLGGSSDKEFVVTYRPCGIYRRRQWYFEFSGTEELVLVSATEEFEELEN